MSKLISELLLDLPERVRKGDFVLNLSKGVNEPQKTLERYVVTPQLVECFNDSLKLIKTAVGANNSKAAYLYKQRGNFSEATQDADRLIKLNPAAIVNWQAAADVACDEKGWGRGVEIWLRAVEQNPENAEFLNNLGVARLRSGDGPGSIGDFGNAIALDPTNTIYVRNRGASHASLQNWQQALSDYEDTARLRDAWVESWAEFCRVILSLGDIEKAQETFVRATNHFSAAEDPQTLETLLWIGMLVNADAGTIANLENRFNTARQEQTQYETTKSTELLLEYRRTAYQKLIQLVHARNTDDNDHESVLTRIIRAMAMWHTGKRDSASKMLGDAEKLHTLLSREKKLDEHGGLLHSWQERIDRATLLTEARKLIQDGQ